LDYKQNTLLTVDINIQMTPNSFLILILVNIAIAFGIAKYQQKNGYKLLNSFIGAFIGLIGLTFLVLKMLKEL